MRHFNTSNKLLRKLQMLSNECADLVYNQEMWQLSVAELEALSHALKWLKISREVVLATPYKHEGKVSEG